MSILKKVLTITLSITFVSCFFGVPVLAQGSYGLQETAGAAGLTQYGGDLPTLAGNVIGTALSMVGVLFFILMLYGGFLWMTARGKEDQANKAKETIIAAVIGILVVLSAYAITNFVFSSIQGESEFGTGAEELGGGEQLDCTIFTTQSTCEAVSNPYCEWDGCAGLAFCEDLATEEECNFSDQCIWGGGCRNR